jgi:hypothetical protein
MSHYAITSRMYVVPLLLGQSARSQAISGGWPALAISYALVLRSSVRLWQPGSGSQSDLQALVAFYFKMSPSVTQYSPEYLAEDNGPTIIATASLMIILCTVFVGLRYYARYLTSTKFGAEDIIIPFALLAELGLCVVGIRTYEPIARIKSIC